MKQVNLHKLRSGFPVRMHYFNGDRFGEHKHEYLEILIVTENGGKHIVDDTEYILKRGDVYLIGPYHSHAGAMYAGEKLHYYNIELMPEVIVGYGTGADTTTLLRPFYDPMRFAPVTLDADDMTQCESIARVMLSEIQRQKPCYEESVTHLLTALLSIITRHMPIKENTSENAVLGVLRLLNDNFQRDMDNTEIAAKVELSAVRLAQVFKKSTGMTVRDALVRRRLAEAKRLLTTTDIPVIETMIASGFNDVSYFNRVFKRSTGLTPSAYRDKFSP